MCSIHWHRSPAQPPAAAGPPPGVTVSVSQGVRERLAGLPPALGSTVEVVVGDPQRAAVIIVGAIGPAGAAFLRARYPAARLMVLGHYATGGEGIGYLDAGADAYLAGATLDEVAAHVRALLRRPSHGGEVDAPPQRAEPVSAPPAGVTGRQAS